MSDGNNRNDGFQDYLDLLEKYKDEVPDEIPDNIGETEVLNESDYGNTEVLNKINLEVFDDPEAKKIAPPPFLGNKKGKIKQNKFIKKISRIIGFLKFDNSK